MRPIDADELKKDLTRFYDNEVTAKQLIDEQPTIEPEQRWIPVSKRLPETDNFRTEFEVTYKTENGKYKVTSMKWENTVVRGKKVSRWIWNDRIAPWKVVAWKPFSEPYQGGEQDE